MTEVYEMPFSVTQQKILYYAPKPSAMASILCSIYIIQKILRDPKRRCRVYHRIILALSFHTILFCLAMSLGSWPIPKDSKVKIYGANGTDMSCTIQGFVLIFQSITVSSFYLLLSLFSFIAVRQNFNETILHKYELIFHTFIYLIPLVFSCVALNKKYINPSVGVCYIGPYPEGCLRNDKIPCIHGYSGLATYYNLSSVYFVLSFAVAVVLIISLYIFVRRKEKQNENLVGKKKYYERARKFNSRIILTQAGLYIGAFIFIYIFPVYNQINAIIRNNYNFSSFLLARMMMSFHGVVHLFVYQRLLRRSEDRKLVPIEQRVTLSNPSRNAERLMSSGACHRKLFCSADKPVFSIFDGTNASENWGEFIDPPSDFCHDNELEGKDKKAGNQKSRRGSMFVLINQTTE